LSAEKNRAGTKINKYASGRRRGKPPGPILLRKSNQHRFFRSPGWLASPSPFFILSEAKEP
jgi:hypothetical protein